MGEWGSGIGRMEKETGGEPPSLPGGLACVQIQFTRSTSTLLVLGSMMQT